MRTVQTDSWISMVDGFKNLQQKINSFNISSNICDVFYISVKIPLYSKGPK